MLEKKTVSLSEMHTEKVKQAKLKLCFTELNMIVARGMVLKESFRKPANRLYLLQPDRPQKFKAFCQRPEGNSFSRARFNHVLFGDDGFVLSQPH